MMDPSGQTIVRIFTAPTVACGTGMSWASAVEFIRERLRLRFGARVVVDHIEIFSQWSFAFPAVLEAIQGGAQLPIVLVGDRIVSRGGKLSESRIARAVEPLGVTGSVEQRKK